MNYLFREIEKRWQKYWKSSQIFKGETHSKKPKCYVLDMFPYPSGAGLHVGHPLGYIASDIYARYQRSQGYNVLHPMGFDSFGLPAEQYAIQTGQHPNVTNETNIQRYKEQLEELGFSFDWSRELRTSDPSYYRWTQWIFLQLFNSWYDQSLSKARSIDEIIKIFEKQGNLKIKASGDKIEPFNADQWSGFPWKRKNEILQNYRLAFRSETIVNWCPALGTILSNDEIKEGKSERGGHTVYQKKMTQWSMRITTYAERLLKGLDQIQWPEALKETQRNWIGKSFGAKISFSILDKPSLNIEVFTTRPDTIFGVSFMVLAPEHSLIGEISTSEEKKSVEEYLQASKKRSERERLADTKSLSGVFIGAYALHPFTKEKLPVYVSDYILAGYGTGAVMAVPAHDERDHRFAKKFELKIKRVIHGGDDVQKQAYEAKEGQCIHSDFLNGLNVKEAILKAIEKIEEKKLGQRMINYRLRDAVFSRQRYWGEPIPIYYKKGIALGIPQENLPLCLPDIDKYLPTEKGEPPLQRAAYWAWDEKGQKIVSNELIDDKNVFPLETSTMPGWAGSSWYFLRYMDPENKDALINSKVEAYWQNVDLYVGGSEHATGHLLYSRFWHKFLKDQGYVSTEEPFKKLINQGMILGDSAFIARLEKSQDFISVDLIKDQKTQQIHVDIHLLKNGNELDIEKLKEWRPEYAQAKFIMKDGKFFCKRKVEKMSKSKYNVINPDEICKQYGADTLRMYEMFLGPIDQTKPWNIRGISGIHQFLRKFWRLFYTKERFYVESTPPSYEALKILHRTVKKIKEDIPRFSFNTSISAFMIAVNELNAIKCNNREVLEPLVIIIAPFAPHIAEELWMRLGHKNSVSFAPIPEYNERYLMEEMIEYPIMFNGKLRFKMNFPSEIDEENIKKTILKHPQTEKYLGKRNIIKIIFISKKIVNIVL
ncbi:leucine--tRNA ligase [Bacteroidetes bacterium endosymbiont of Geopemphigus sp.]|uniref:leucine--tRNA ligase n=1 Tax=Bacteroidetes bacterium endosymbiont of Geopemphigus sp. TaxID=2047937 RepID=UPI000CD323E1|nr:leucine--tRNA ligase [Bacteroidetes bacterium endosymbiont of Geopemphigus sp.]